MTELLVIDITAAITAFVLWALIVSLALLGTVASWAAIIQLVRIIRRYK